MKNLNSREIHEAIDQALAEVSRRLASGELDQSGRYDTDAEQAARPTVCIDPVKPRRVTAA